MCKSGGKGRGRVGEADSILSVELNTGLDLMTREIMTQAEIKRGCLTEPPRCHKDFFIFK